MKGRETGENGMITQKYQNSDQARSVRAPTTNQAKLEC